MLPTYVVKRSEDYPAWGVVICPRADCGETFLIKLSAWYKRRYSALRADTLFHGRSCPYCFKVALPPPRATIRYNRSPNT